MRQPNLVVIDIANKRLTRYEGKQATHGAYANRFDARVIEGFRVSPDDEFRLTTKPEAA